MTFKTCFKYNRLNKPIMLICKDGLTCATFPGQAVNQYSDGLSISYIKLCLETQTAHVILQAPMGRDII